jgi:hypothetical protein
VKILDKKYIEIGEIKGNKDLHDIAIKIRFEDKNNLLPRDITREQFIEEIITDIKWQLDMVRPSVSKQILNKAYDEILSIKKREELKEKRGIREDGKIFDCKVESAEDEFEGEM